MSLPKPFYDADGCTIYCGDCREILPELEAPDIVLTSPPYNVGLKYGDGFDDKIADDAFWTFNRNWISRIQPSGTQRFYAVIGDKMLWRFKEACELEGWKYCQKLVWCKSNLCGSGSITGDWNHLTEDILLFRRGKRTNMLKAIEDGTNTLNWFVIPTVQSNFNGDNHRQHPAQFPIELPRKLISRTPGDMVIDPFMGSGSTLRAAKDLGRRAIGIEINEDYCKIAVERLRQGVLIAV